MNLTPRPALPMAADEVTTLRAYLDRYRTTIRRQVEDLSSAELREPSSASAMTLGGLVKHLAFVEHWWFHVVLAGQPMGAPWDAVNWRVDEDWDWRSSVQDDAEVLLALFETSVAASERIVTDALVLGGLDQIALRSRAEREAPSLRWIMLHLIGEYARHAGHADLLREGIDGVTGR